MKYTAILSIVFTVILSSNSYSQKAIFNKITKESTFTEYQTKDGFTLKVGDTITIAYPSTGNAFAFITQGNQPTAAFLANNKVIVSKIKSIGAANRGFKAYALFKGYGLPIYIDYEAALDKGEIKNPFQITQ